MFSRHLSRARLVELAEGELPDAAAAAHLHRCARCRAGIDVLAAALASAREVPPPEPSPLFWAHFPERVTQAIEASGSLVQSAPAGPIGRFSSRGSTEVLPHRRWLWLGAGSLLVVAAGLWLVAIRGTRGDHPPVPSPVPTTADAVAADDLGWLEPLPADDASWLLVLESGELDWDTAAAAGLTVTPGSVERLASEISAEERSELMRLLREGIERKGRAAGL